MKKLMRLAMLITLAILLVGCSGCSPQNEPSNDSSNSFVSFPTDFAAPTGAYDEACVNLICSPDKLDYSMVSSLMAYVNDDITVDQNIKTSGTGNEYVMYKFTGTAGSGFYSEKTGSFRYSTVKGDQISELISFAAQLDSERIYESEAISSIEIDYIIEEMTSWFGKIKIEPYVVLPLSSKILNEMNEDALPIFEQMEEEEFPIQYSKQYVAEDECYYVLMHAQYNNIPLYQTEFWPANGVGNGISAPWIQLIVSANGIEYVEVNNMWAVRDTAIQGEIMSFDRACENYATYHQQLIGEEKIVISNISLEYVPVMIEGENYTEVVEYRAAYVFERSDMYSIEAYDAVTGEVLSWVE